MNTTRRDTLKKLAAGAAGVTLGSMGLTAKSYSNIIGSNDRINMCVIGVRGQGHGHLRRWAGMAEENNVRVRTICDADENLFAERVKTVTDLQGDVPGTEVDMRKVFDDDEIDAVSIATPNHWHALATIWAVQAGKHVYVEKPSSHNVWEGRKMIEAARKYDRIVQVGFQNRSINNVRRAIQLLHDGVIGDVYMARGLCFKPRDSFGIAKDNDPPAGLHYDLWLGPAEWRPYNEMKGHYNWHWHWDTGNGDNGNQGPHQYDIARWGLNKNEHPIRIQSMGGYYKFTADECSQETPNTQTTTFEYADGKLLQFEVRGLFTAGEDSLDVKIGNLFYGTDGWMEIRGSNFKTYLGRDGESGPSSDDSSSDEGGAALGYLAAPGGGGHYNNFIAAVRSGDKKNLTCDIEVGHLSTALPLLGNISYRMGQELYFNGDKEKFIGNNAANALLTREYRDPYVVPNVV